MTTPLFTAEHATAALTTIAEHHKSAKFTVSVPDGGFVQVTGASLLAMLTGRPASPDAAPNERAAQIAEQLRDLARRQSERGNHSLAETLGEAANLLSPRGKWFISESLACQRAEGCTSPADCSSTDTCKGAAQ